TGGSLMQLADHFDVLLKDTVNLSQFKLETLETRGERDLRGAHPRMPRSGGDDFQGKDSAGDRGAHRTIIPAPQKGGKGSFDADFMLDMDENPGL
ncbi:hypothetical protein HR12_48125, partial [Microbacterium sp. SUBG005]